MTKKIKCIKIQKELDAMDFQPFPGELGKKIYENVSQIAWKEWLEKQKMLVNEYRLNLSDIKAREFLMKETEKYFFQTTANQNSEID